ncbi:MAG TPA: VOC family protein [Micropepsaceae bacterium]|nr:VOC family protein [Micropepsaceae bacterium]
MAKRAPTLGTYLTVKDANGIIAYYKRAFGAKEVMRMKADDGRIMHAELALFGGTLMLSDEFPEYGNTKSPATIGNTTFNMMVGLAAPKDVDAALKKGAKTGGAIVMEAADQFWGARFGMLRDPAGHLWAFNADLPKPAKKKPAAASAKAGSSKAKKKR